MRIAINTRFLLPHKMEGFGWYTFEIVKRLVENHPNHTFIFLFDRPFDDRFIFGDNVEAVILKPQARHPILFKIWFNRSVTRALKKYQADIFFSPDGYLSLKTNIPQVGVIHDINFEHFPEDLPKSPRNYLRTYFPKFAHVANHIITVSEASKQDICTTYNISEDKITVSWNGASDAFKPISDLDQQDVRDKYSDGRPYLLFVGALHPRKNLRRLLAAFEELRNDENCPYELIIVGEALWKGSALDSEISDSLQKHIHFTGHVPLDELARIMASATVFTFVPYFEGFGIPLVEAMKSGTTILSGNKTSLPEVAGNAALYCDPFDVDDIYEKLCVLLNDSKLRMELIQKGLERSRLFSWEKSAENVWDVLVKTAERN